MRTRMKYKKIKDRIQQMDLIEKYGSRIDLIAGNGELYNKFDQRNYEATPLSAYCTVISDWDFDKMLDEVVQFTFEETIRMIKRQVNDIE